MEKKNILILALITLVFNLIWEFSHYSLYNDVSSITGPAHLIMASFSDVLCIFLAFGIVSLINKNINWINQPNSKTYFLTIVFAMIIAIAIEVVNVYFLKRWAYKEIMPIIFGIGLSPLLQLAITGSLSLWIYRKLIV